MFSSIHKNRRCLLFWSRGLLRPAAANLVGNAARFMRDCSGAYAIVFGLMAPMFVGALALGSETGLWYSTQQRMQGVADSSAISAAVGLIGGDTNSTLEADATAASDGFVTGSSGTVITVNVPPQSGPNKGTKGDVEVIISQTQKLLFSSLFLKSPVVIQARAVAGPDPEVNCVIALSKILPLVPGITTAVSNVLADQCNIADNSASPLALTVAALANIRAQKINVVGGFVDLVAEVTPTPHTGAAATADPYQGTSVPNISNFPCNQYSFSTHGNITGTVTLSPGRYCGGMTVIGGGNVTLSPGTYYMDELPGFVILGGSVTGTGIPIRASPPTFPRIPAAVLFQRIIRRSRGRKALRFPPRINGAAPTLSAATTSSAATRK